MNYSDSVELRWLIRYDSVLLLRTILQAKSYEARQYRELFTHALRNAAWYCANELYPLIANEECTLHEQSSMLEAAVLSNEPKMLAFAYCDRDALFCITETGRTFIEELVLRKNHKMLHAVMKLTTFTRDDFSSLTLRNQRKGLCSATVEVMMAGSPADTVAICQAVLDSRRKRLDDTFTLIHAIMENDYMMVQHMMIHHHTTSMNILAKGSSTKLFENFFHKAAGTNAVQSLKVLQEWIDLETPDQHQNTMLHMASLNGCLSTVELLLAAGANPAARNCIGLTPIDMVLHNEGPSPRAVALLTKYLSESELADIGSEWWYELRHSTLEAILYHGDGAVS